MSSGLLGVHLIVKDEADCISRCLDSIQPIADELIVVDTGSKDGTVTIASDRGAKVIESGWTDDFAQARNVALAHATTEWVLVIDADECISSGAEQIKPFLLQTDADSLTVEIDNLFGEQPWERLRSFSTRLFRRQKGFRFAGPIHEQLVSTDGHHPAASKLCPLKLVHDGYLPRIMGRKRKAERNLRILQRLANENPGDAFHLYNLGVTYCQLGQPWKAAELFAEARQRVPDNAPYRPTLIRDSSKVWIELGQWEDVRRLLHTECGRYPGYKDLHHLYGTALEQGGRLQEALESYWKAVQHGVFSAEFVSEEGIGSYLTYQALARLSRKLGNAMQAGVLYRKCLEEKPDYEPVYLEWADLLQQLEVPDEQIEELFRNILDTGQNSTGLRLGRLLAAIGAYPQALKLLDGETLSVPDDRRMLLECRMRTGSLQAAYLSMDAELLAGRFAEADKTEKTDAPADTPATALDIALCGWSEGKELPYRFYKQLSAEDRQSFEQLELMLLGKLRADRLSSPQSTFLCAEQLLERAIELNMLAIASRIAGLEESLTLTMAKLLYRNGYTLFAADLLLSLMKLGKTDPEGLYMIAEILYDKSHYSHAAAIFERVLEQKPGCDEARIGIALCYLQLARGALLDGIERTPGHSALHQDLQRLDRSIQLLGAADWHTQWHAALRRNKHAAPPHIAVHDR